MDTKTFVFIDSDGSNSLVRATDKGANELFLDAVYINLKRPDEAWGFILPKAFNRHQAYEVITAFNNDLFKAF